MQQRPPIALACLATVLSVAAALLPVVPSGADDAWSDVPRSPMGGPVDREWLTAGPGFTRFDGEPAPSGGPVWPGVYRDARSTTLGDGRNVDVQILHLDPGADVEIRPTMAFGVVRGLATVAQQSGDPIDLGAVAATNGGFWLGHPFGEPNGFFAIADRLVSDAESQGVGPRGTVGWLPDGTIVIDRVDSLETILLPDGTSVTVDGINRGHREHDELFADGVDSLLAYTLDHGGQVTVRQPERPPPPPPPPPPPGTPTPEPSATPTPEPPPPPVDLAVVRLAAPAWPATGQISAQVIGVSRDTEGVFTPGLGEVLVVGTGAGAAALDDLQVADVVFLGTSITALDPGRDAAWAQVTRGLAGGPMVVKGGAMTDPADWVSEGFEPHVHSDVRAPRTAIGVTAEGRTLMVVADGRRPGITHGFTIAELARYMISLGAVEAVSLDGGGSSQLVVDGLLRNRPCCDTSTRAVATSLQIVHPPVFDRTSRLRGAGRVDTAAAIARSAYPQGTDTAVLAVADRFPDALAGGPLAAVLGGPLLLSASTAVPTATLNVLADLGVRHVVLLGGEAVLADSVDEVLVARGMTTERLAGGSRVDTAAVIARRLAGLAAFAGQATPPALPGAGVDRVFLASASSFADALVAAGPGGLLRMPILLHDGATLHPANAAFLSDEAVTEVVLVGGTARLPTSVAEQLRARGVGVTRLAGSGRFQTAAAVNGWLVDQQVPLGDGLIVATGDDFPDALAGGPLAATRRARLMIVPGGSIDADPGAAAFFSSIDGRIATVEVLGGPIAVGSYHQWQLEQLATAPR